MSSVARGISIPTIRPDIAPAVDYRSHFEIPAKEITIDDARKEVLLSMVDAVNSNPAMAKLEDKVRAIRYANAFLLNK